MNTVLPVLLDRAFWVDVAFTQRTRPSSRDLLEPMGSFGWERLPSEPLGFSAVNSNWPEEPRSSRQNRGS
jgi:hypothetical protein